MQYWLRFPNVIHRAAKATKTSSPYFGLMSESEISVQEMTA
jgi:hypothetical protein